MVAMFVLLHANPLKEDLVKRSFDKFTHLGEDAIKSSMSLKGDDGSSMAEIRSSSPMKETSMTSNADDAFGASDIRNANKMKESVKISSLEYDYLNTMTPQIMYPSFAITPSHTDLHTHGVNETPKTEELPVELNAMVGTEDYEKWIRDPTEAPGAFDDEDGAARARPGRL